MLMPNSPAILGSAFVGEAKGARSGTWAAAAARSPVRSVRRSAAGLSARWVGRPYSGSTCLSRQQASPLPGASLTRNYAGRTAVRSPEAPASQLFGLGNADMGANALVEQLRYDEPRLDWLDLRFAGHLACSFCSNIDLVTRR